MMSEREKAMKKVQMYDFVLLEAGLFLDTHPENQDALEYYAKYKKMAMEAQREYAEKYGPISHVDMQDKMKSWKWIKSPWPWEREEK